MVDHSRSRILPESPKWRFSKVEISTAKRLVGPVSSWPKEEPLKLQFEGGVR
jgi:hypothetical protein